MNEQDLIIDVLIVDDHPIVRDGITALLEGHKKYRVMGEAANGEEALLKIKSLRPNIVIMDINMPVMNGIECTRKIMKKYDRVRVLVLSMHNEDVYLRKMLEAGASGYILKSAGKDELLKALDRITSGHLYFSEEVTMSVLREMNESDEVQKKGKCP